jgi:hypothetical protein
LRVTHSRGRRGVMKKISVHRVDSPNGEIHLVLEETEVSENCDCFTDMAEIKKISKKEAAKPLDLFREE